MRKKSARFDHPDDGELESSHARAPMANPEHDERLRLFGGTYGFGRADM